MFRQATPRKRGRLRDAEKKIETHPFEDKLTKVIELQDGEWIPEDTVVGVPHYAIHHNAQYFPQPFDYKPERWTAGSDPTVTTESVNTAQSAFCPFSVGPRGCIGKGTREQSMFLENV